MRIVTTREFRNETKAVFELAEKEKVAVKRGKKYVNLIVSNRPDAKFLDEKWVKEFMSIPMKYRCNPFEYSPSGDLFFADKRNVKHLKEAIKQAKEGKVTRCSTKEELHAFLESL